MRDIKMNFGESTREEILKFPVLINRVSKVVKGGRRFSFSALVVVGNGAGKVGYSSGKAQSVPEAVKKATVSAIKNMIYVSLKGGRTIHHDVIVSAGAGKVLLRKSKKGTGIIASFGMRCVFEALGVKDIVTKSQRSNNPYNSIRATFKALQQIIPPQKVFALRKRRWE